MFINSTSDKTVHYENELSVFAKLVPGDKIQLTSQSTAVRQIGVETTFIPSVGQTDSLGQQFSRWYTSADSTATIELFSKKVVEWLDIAKDQVFPETPGCDLRDYRGSFLMHVRRGFFRLMLSHQNDADQTWRQAAKGAVDYFDKVIQPLLPVSFLEMQKTFFLNEFSFFTHLESDEYIDVVTSSENSDAREFIKLSFCNTKDVDTALQFEKKLLLLLDDYKAYMTSLGPHIEEAKPLLKALSKGLGVLLRSHDSDSDDEDIQLFEKTEGQKTWSNKIQNVRSYIESVLLNLNHLEK